MTKDELLKHYKSDDYQDYLTHYLVKHWQDESGKGKWQELVTVNFMDRHTVDGTVTEQKAIDLCRVRSQGGTRDFVSTLLAEDLVKKVVLNIAKNIIKWHGDNIKGFANYLINEQGMLCTVVCKANEGFISHNYRDAVVVGINKEGLINHFDGDATYANTENPIYKQQGRNIVRM